MGLAVTLSNWRRLPSGVGNPGRFMVSPRASSASMPWMRGFMRDMAMVAGSISWPQSRHGAVAVQARVLAGDGADGVGEQLAESGGLLLQIGPARAGRNIEADEFVVLVNKAGTGAEALQLVLVNVGEALEEDEREDLVLELRRVNGAADDAGGFPKPGFES